MEKTEQTGRVKAIREYLSGIGHDISSVQAHEVLARALGFKNKHVLAKAKPGAPETLSAPSPAGSVVVDGETVPVRATSDDPFTVEQMRAMNWTFDVVIPMPLDRLDDIDTMNDFASQAITGNEVALEDINFDHVPQVVYPKGWVAYRVTGVVSSPADLFEEEAEAEEQLFYEGLAVLAERLLARTPAVVLHRGIARSMQVDEVDEDVLRALSVYAETQGKDTQALERLQHMDAAVLRGSDGFERQLEIHARLMDLRYANRLNEHTFEFETNKKQYTVAFAT